MPPSSTDKQTRALLDALARVLAPLVRLLIARGVTFQMASELLKRVYVQAAQRHFSADDAATGTRLSLLPGLNRKEIRRLTSDAADDKRPEDMTSFASAAHDLWCSGRRWRDRDGNPKPLPRHTSGRQASFDDLVRAITLDHRPSAVLAELLRLGYATEDGDGKLRPNRKPFQARHRVSQTGRLPVPPVARLANGGRGRTWTRPITSSWGRGRRAACWPKG